MPCRALPEAEAPPFELRLAQMPSRFQRACEVPPAAAACAGGQCASVRSSAAA